MMTMKNNQQGFTFIESLIVLSIFLLITSLSLLLLQPHHKQLQKQQFFTQLKSDLLYAQQYALTTQKMVSVNFVTPNHFYYVLDEKGEYLIRREYPENIKIMGGTQRLGFRYLSSGNINQFGSINIYIDGEPYQLTFQLGRGRFYVKKL